MKILLPFCLIEIIWLSGCAHAVLPESANTNEFNLPAIALNDGDFTNLGGLSLQMTREKADQRLQHTGWTCQKRGRTGSTWLCARQTVIAPTHMTIFFDGNQLEQISVPLPSSGDKTDVVCAEYMQALTELTKRVGEPYLQNKHMCKSVPAELKYARECARWVGRKGHLELYARSSVENLARATSHLSIMRAGIGSCNQNTGNGFP